MSAGQDSELGVYVSAQGYYIAPEGPSHTALSRRVSPFFETQDEAYEWLAGHQS